MAVEAPARTIVCVDDAVANQLSGKVVQGFGCGEQFRLLWKFAPGSVDILRIYAPHDGTCVALRKILRNLIKGDDVAVTAGFHVDSGAHFTA